MARKKKKKTSIPGIDTTVVALLILSVILSVLIYKQTGLIGEKLSPILGGIMGIMKNVIPVGTFILAIIVACKKGNSIGKKILQFVVFLVFLASIFSIYLISNNDIVPNDRKFEDVISEAYSIGENGRGGGAIGTIVAIPLTKLMGQVAASILSLGVCIMMLVFIFEIRVSDIISNTVDKAQERQTEKKEARRQYKIQMEKEAERQARYLAKHPNSRKKTAEPNTTNLTNSFEMLEQQDVVDEPKRKETLRERRAREKEEEAKRAAEIDDQLKINLSGLESQNDDSILTPPTGLFKKEEAKTEDKSKEVLTIQHSVSEKDENYEFPPITFLDEPTGSKQKGGKNDKNLEAIASKLQKTLYSFGVSAKVEDVSVGPAITRYELKPAEGVRVSKIANLADDIALNLAAKSIRIEAPIPGKQAVGIEIPNEETEMVHLRELIESDLFIKQKSKLAFALGKDVAGDGVVTDIAKMPHVLIAGATGSGKSVCINTLITSIIYKAKPNEVKFLMIDPKIVELSVYNDIPHLLIPVVTDAKKAEGALNWAVQEMENRYNMFASKGVKDLKSYNKEVDEKENGEGKLPQIVIIIDELADLMMATPKDVEAHICRLAQKARAAGMHLVIATQRPSVDVITGVIKANIPSRIAFSVSSQIDSRTILDMAGAEKLLGKGDMLFYPAGIPKPVRVQGAFVTDEEIDKIVSFLKDNGGQVTYNQDIIDSINNSDKEDVNLEDEGGEEDNIDPLLNDAIELVIDSGTASTSYIQRRFKVGYARAGRIIDQMEERGIISGYQGSKPRTVLISKERWAELNAPTEPQPTSKNDEDTETKEE